MHQIFTEFSLILAISAAAGFISLRLRQPVIIAYIVVGIVVGPSVFGLVSASSQIDLLAQVGVAVLLFLVGLKLDLQSVRHTGPVALATGLGQLSFTIVIGFLLILALGKGWTEALYVAVALTFSSTIIIIKLLSDKRELDSLHGRIAVGFLIVQDLAVVFAMMVMSGLREVGSGEASVAWILFVLAIKIVLATVALWFIMKTLMPRLLPRIAHSQELLLIFAVAWGTGFAALGEWAGFSKEAGAFLAGFTLASSGYRDAISARLSGIRDFLLLFFFIDLGSKLNFAILGEELFAASVLSLFVLIGNPLIVMAIMGYMGYRKRTGFMAGLTVAQISEFSIIFVAMGITLGHVNESALGLTTLVGLITIAASTYMILYSHLIYDRIAGLIGFFERRNPFREQALDASAHTPRREPEILVFGLGRYGSELIRELSDSESPVLGCDFDPETVARMREQGLDTHFGDVTDEDFLAHLPLRSVRWVVTTLPDLNANRELLQALKRIGFKGRVAIVSRESFPDSTQFDWPDATVLFPLHSAVLHAVQELTALIRRPESSPVIP